MFEQSLYEQPFQTPQTDEDEKLFDNYEIRTWDLGSRIYKIIGMSAAVNLLAVAIVAQGSLLTMKGCDSPLVGRVCSVLDTVYVGSMLFGTDREYIDAAYDQTKIEDSEVTFIDVSNIDPGLNYPESFVDATTGATVPMLPRFGAQDPMLAMNTGMPDIDLGTMPNQFPMPTTGGSLLDTPQVLPKDNPNVISGNLPDFNSGSTSTYTPPKPRRTPKPKNPSNLPDLDDNDVAEVKPTPTPTPEAGPTPVTSEAMAAVQINKKPLVDFADDVSIKWESKQVDLNQNFKLVLDGVITEDGKLDATKSKFDTKNSSGDKAMLDVGKAALEALGNSGYLSYLKLAGIDKIKTVLVQDDENITVSIVTQQPTTQRANTVSSMVGFAVMLGRGKIEDPSDEKTLLDSLKTSVKEKSFNIDFVIPKTIAHEMINRKLREAQAKKAAQPKPNGSLMTNKTSTNEADAK